VQRPREVIAELGSETLRLKTGAEHRCRPPLHGGRKARLICAGLAAQRLYLSATPSTPDGSWPASLYYRWATCVSNLRLDDGLIQHASGGQGSPSLAAGRPDLGYNEREQRCAPQQLHGRTVDAEQPEVLLNFHHVFSNGLKRRC
jgi:hypothetical protein